jgi:ADP-heptose:LPS heptosyltransferase
MSTIAQDAASDRRVAEPERARPSERFTDVERIAVLRGGGLGDFVFALPALHALHETYPDAEITVLGAPLHAELMHGRPGPPDSVVAVPPSEGVRPGPVDPGATDAFFAGMRERRFDLAVQLHGGGRHSNPFVRRLAARHTLGTRSPDAEDLERTIPYLYYQNEFVRALEVVALAGAEPGRYGCEPVLASVPDISGVEVLARHGIRVGGEPLVVVHPGASDARRRWPAEHFARVAAELSAAGAFVVAVGDAGERGLCGAVVHGAAQEAARGSRPGAGSVRVASAAGRLDLGELAAVLQAADVVVANDSGPRHLAHALGTATVAVYWIGNLINAGPLTRARHRVHLAWTARCPVCGTDCTGADPAIVRCEHEVSFVADVPWRDVCDSALELLGHGPVATGTL